MKICLDFPFNAQEPPEKEMMMLCEHVPLK